MVNSATMDIKQGYRLTVDQLLLLIFICALGTGIRLYDLTDAPLDFHPTRQLRSAIISRAVYYRLNQTADPEQRQLASRLAELEVYEPPILETLTGFTNWIVGEDLFWTQRIYNAIFWAAGGLALFGMLLRFVPFTASLLSLAFYFFLPFSVIASRSLQPEPWMVMWILFTGFALVRWSEERSWKWAVLAAAAGSIAVLVKAVAAFFVGPMLIGAALAAFGWKFFYRKAQPWVMGVGMLAPTLVYYLVFHSGRSAGFLSFWTVSLSGLVLTSNFYADWLAMIKGLMGQALFMAAILGTLAAPARLRAVLFGGWVGYGLYGLVFPYQYTTHEYYHLPLVALVGLGIGPVVAEILTQIKVQSIPIKLVAAGVFGFAIVYNLWTVRSVLYVHDYKYEPASWQNVAEAIPPEKHFVALTGDYGMRLSYYGWRSIDKYWPTTSDLNLFALAGQDPLAYKNYFEEICKDEDLFLVTAFSELDAQPELKVLLTSYPVYTEGNGFVVYNLKP